MPKLVLASTSRYRRDLLSRLGVPFEVEPPECDEEAVQRAGHPPAELAVLLARLKALSVCERLRQRGEHDAVVLGSDQVVELEGAILGKPHTAERACAQLERLSGKSHRLLTAFCLQPVDAALGPPFEHLDTTTLTMRTLSPDEVARVVAKDQPLDCAGSYRLEATGIALFDAIHSDDHTAIIGLPLMAVARGLRQFGYVIP